ncbi:EAL domain-containing protein [Simiduia curdlanivorans]|uniref:EAL domain-containing protein n=1 Tax=Simiduia curdlanivorans TaxID=1492769 RepID=A0ABV8V559_9GAMM|nr:EAL domain-containing protein [Simiduia curdlanivorans]MDN3640520.1 EAL domain-containing protein [Simiduia curdlanivorans]
MIGSQTNLLLPMEWPAIDTDVSVGLFWKALNLTDVALWRWDMKAGRLYLSSQFYAFSQLDPACPVDSFDQLLGLLSSAQQEKLLRTVGRAVKHRRVRFGCDIQLNNGVWIYFLGGCEHNAREVVGFVTNSVVNRSTTESLETNRQLFDGLFDSSQVATALLTAEGAMLRANAACEHLFQLTPGSLLTRYNGSNLLADSIFSEAPLTHHEMMASFNDGKALTLNLACNLGHLLGVQPSEAQVLQLRARMSPMLDEQKRLRFILVQYEDRSAELQARNALARNTNLMSGVLSHRGAPPIAVKDVKGTYLLANDRYQNLFFTKPVNIIGLRDEHLLEASTVSLLHRREQEAINREDTITEEQSLPLMAEQAKDYVWSCFPVRDENSNIFAVGHIFTDISHIHQQQQVINKQRKELRLLLDNVQDMILYLDRWGRVKNSNASADAFFHGKSLNGLTLVEVFVDCPQIPQLQREIMQVVRTNYSEVGITESLWFGDRQYWFEVDKVPTSSDSGQVDGVMLVLHDVTKQKIIEQELLDSEGRYRAFISNCMDGIWCCRLEPPIDVSLPVEQQVDQLGERALFSECNQVMADFRDCASPESMLGVPMFDRGIEAHREGMRRFIAAGYRLLDIPTFRDKNNGERLEFTVSTLGIVDNGFLCHVWGITRDVTERHRYLAKMEYQANHDALTGLPNRNFLYKKIKKVLSAKSLDQLVALLIIDLNRFKDLNDTLGHQTGDKLLKQIGPRLLDELSYIDSTVARLGGDEFAVFLPSIRNAQQAVVVAHRVLDAIREPYNLDGFHSEIGAAIGISIRSEKANDVSTLMRYADVAMYNAKAQYSGISVYSSDIDPHSPKRFSLMSELRRAIREDELFLHFQPKIELSTQRLHGFEALLRWDHPTLGFVSPAEFIPMAEATDIIHPLTEWVLKQSIEQCRLWHDRNFFVSVAINLSTRNLMDEKLPRKIASLLADAGLPPTALELEITESAIMSDPTRALLILQQLSEMGIKLSIDDFGTGYSSLAYLKKLPVQALKIDYSFVLNMLQDKQDEIIVRSTINLAHNLGLHVVAEGVENQETLSCLEAMGCNQAQGYFLGRPMPEASIAEWYASTDWLIDQEGDEIPPSLSKD